MVMGGAYCNESCGQSPTRYFSYRGGDPTIRRMAKTPVLQKPSPEPGKNAGSGKVRAP